MRIQGNHFSYNLYITDINNNKFTVILGFDFLSQFPITIAPSFNAILFKNKKIPFVNDKEYSNVVNLMSSNENNMTFI